MQYRTDNYNMQAAQGDAIIQLKIKFIIQMGMKQFKLVMLKLEKTLKMPKACTIAA